MKRSSVQIYGFVGLLATAIAPMVRAEGTAELKIADQPRFTGESFIVVIETGYLETCDTPQFSELADCTVHLRDTTEDTATHEYAGRRVVLHTRSYTYEVTAAVAGPLTIPAIPIRLDGTTLATRPTTVLVRASDADQLFAATITTGRAYVYVEQRVPVILTLWIRPPASAGRTLTPEELLASRLQLDMDFGPFPPEPTRVTLRPKPGEDSDTPYFAYEYATHVVAERPGPLPLPSIAANITYPTDYGSRALSARAVADAVEVRPVPQTGRPATFTGAVGVFAIETSATPTQVRVADPIELVIEILGDGPIERLRPPQLTANAALVRDFRLPGEIPVGATHDARRRFVLTLRATGPNVHEIPTIEYPYFDPDAERFVVARSEPIPLLAAPAADVSPTTASGAAADGLCDIERNAQTLLGAARPITPAWSAGALITPAVLFLLAWAACAAVGQCTSVAESHRRSAALNTARRRLDQARGQPPRSPGAEIAEVFADYLADRLGKPPARFIGSAALHALQQRHASPELIERCRRLLQWCDEAAFAERLRTNETALVSEARACLDLLERERL